MISDDAAYAANWRTVLLVDGLLGVAVAAAGALLVLVWSMRVVGSLVLVVGVGYIMGVVRRRRRWRMLRTSAGLD